MASSATNLMMSSSSSHDDEAIMGRRQAFQNMFMAAGAAAAVVAAPQISNALDMDAFMSSEVRISYCVLTDRMIESVPTRAKLVHVFYIFVFIIVVF